MSEGLRGAWSFIGTCLVSIPRVQAFGSGSSVRLRIAVTPWSRSQSTWSFEYGLPEAASLPSLTQLKNVGESVKLARILRYALPVRPIAPRPKRSAVYYCWKTRRVLENLELPISPDVELPLSSKCV